MGPGWLPLTAPNGPEKGRTLGSNPGSTVYGCEASGTFLTLSELVSSSTNGGMCINAYHRSGSFTTYDQIVTEHISRARHCSRRWVHW